METLKEWAAFYIDKKIWVYPYMSQEVPWSFWKSKKDKDYTNLSSIWTWNDDIGLKLIVGKKGIRVLQISDRDSISEVLNKLGLPEEYPWVIDSQQGLGIIVDTPNVSKRVFGMTNKVCPNVLLLWEGYYVLPSVGIPAYFYKNRIPQEHPLQVSDDVFVDCFESLVK